MHPKLLLLFALACSLAASAMAQPPLTLSVKDAPLEMLFKEITRQSGYTFFYNDEVLLNTPPVTISVNNATLRQVLDICFKDQPISYEIVSNTIVLKRKPDKQKEDINPVITSNKFSGTVLSSDNQPLEGVTVAIKNTGTTTATDSRGSFVFNNLPAGAVLLVTSVGYHPAEIAVAGRSAITVALQPRISELDETIVIAYGSTSRRYNTGNISRVSAAAIERQPVSNPLLALSGRVPGMVVTQSSGIAGSSVKIQVRGQNSLAQGSDPLFIIDGVPFAANNELINQLSSAANPPNSGAGLSPFNTINPADIESIEVLKDADATAIYGSRGANGVVLITTKKGNAGKTRLSVNVSSGVSKVTAIPAFMNTQQYLRLRSEAFKNDNITPTITNAPDLLVWDTTRYTNFPKLLLDGAGHVTDANITVSGGSASTRFLLGGGYRRETTVFPGGFADTRGSTRLNMYHASPSRKFTANITAGYTFGNNNISTSDIATFINLPPNTPPLYDSAGNLNWQQGGVSFVNPMATLLNQYNARTGNLNANLLITYRLLPPLEFKASVGYNNLLVNETRLLPKTAQNPANARISSSEFATSSFSAWIIEPQLEYAAPVWKGKLVALAGATLQETVNSSATTNATGFANDALMQSLNAAGNITVANSFSQYRYAAVFGRLNYNLFDRYLFNLTARRDGSSRFGPGKQYATFGAMGLAWLFSNQEFVKSHLGFLSFGKLRASYGTSGNDQVGNYKYLDSWNNTLNPYQGTAGLAPAQLFNPSYSWEVNRKLEAALEMGVHNNRLMFTIAAYRNRSSNQLVAYRLPSQAGFVSVIRNFPAVVQNAGLEFEATSTWFSSAHFRWTTSLNVSLQKNKLLSFPGIESSSYASQYVVGQPLSLIYGYSFTGVDPQTGTYTFGDLDRNGSLNSADYVVAGNTSPVLFGGIGNNLQYKGWQLDIFFEGRKQQGRNFFYLNFNQPGTMKNQPVNVLERWQQPGDRAPVGRATTSTTSPAYSSFSRIGQVANNGRYSDASFIRLKNICLAYNFSTGFIRKIKAENCKLYLQGQNLLTITGFGDGDPETQSVFGMPPLRTLTAGFQLTF